MKDQKRAYIYAGLAVLIWSTVASAFKISLRYMSPEMLLLISCLTSTMLLALLLAIRGELGSAIPRSWKAWQKGILLGSMNPFLYYLVLFKAFDLLPAQEAQPLNYTWAITLSLLAAPLLGQRLTRRDLAAAMISYSGVLIISTRGDLLGFHFSSPLGVTLALVSTIIWSLYWIANTRDRRPPLSGLFANFLCATPMIAIYILISSTPTLPPLTGMLAALYVGVCEMGISFVLWLLALKYTESTAKISTLIFLSPVVSLYLIHLLVGEEITASTFMGLAFILAGLIYQQLFPQKVERSDTPNP